MNRAFEKRLRRLRDELMHAEGAALARRRETQALVAVGAGLGRLLAERGVDPAEVVAMRRVEEAAAALPGMPGGVAAGGVGRRHAAAGPPAPGDGRDADDFVRKLVAMALLHHAEGERPDPARASLMEWHAWCLATPASRHGSDSLRDGGVALSRRMLRLGSVAPRWR